jgi:hypothetical protein
MGTVRLSGWVDWYRFLRETRHYRQRRDAVYAALSHNQETPRQALTKAAA